MTDILAWLKSHNWQLIPWAIVIVTIIIMIVALSGAQWPPENMTQIAGWLTLLAVIILIVVAVIYSLGASERTGEEPMPRWKRTFLMAYLLIVGSVLVLMLLSLSSLDFPETPVVPQEAGLAPTPTPTPTPNLTQPTAPARQPATPAPATAGRPAPTATPIVPIVARVFPQQTSGNPPTQYLTIYGRNFQDKSEVRFDSSPVMSKLIANDLLQAQMRAQDMDAKGSIMVDVKNPDGAISNAISVPIDKPKVFLNILYFWRFWRPLITREMQLLLLVICAGALGSYLHAVMSIADFIGGRKLKVSWFWWYLTRPFLGMAMGLIFYAMLRGGFLVGTPADEKFVNPFGVIAIGVLVGMFADAATRKLGEIFKVVFHAADPEAPVRPDKLDETVPLISKLEPNTVPAGSQETAVKIIGEHLSAVTTVKVNEDPRIPDLINDKEVSFKLKEYDLKTASLVKITVVEADGDASAAATFEVTNDTDDESEEAVG